MSQENFSFLRDLEQIAADASGNAEALESIANARPDDAEDIEKLHLAQLKTVADLEDIILRVRANAEPDIQTE